MVLVLKNQHMAEPTFTSNSIRYLLILLMHKPEYKAKSAEKIVQSEWRGLSCDYGLLLDKGIQTQAPRCLG